MIYEYELAGARDDAVDVGHRLRDARALVAAAAIPELQRLVDARAGTAGHDGSHGAVARGELGLHCGVAPAIDHLSADEAQHLGLLVAILGALLAEAGGGEAQQTAGHEAGEHGASGPPQRHRGRSQS